MTQLVFRHLVLHHFLLNLKDLFLKLQRINPGNLNLCLHSVVPNAFSSRLLLLLQLQVMEVNN